MDMSETDVFIQIVTGNIVDRHEGGDSSGISMRPLKKTCFFAIY